MADHSLPLRDKLHTAARPLMRDPAAGDEIQTQATVVCGDADLLGAMKESGALLLMVEDAADRMASHAKVLRAALLDAMVEAGAPGIELEHHVVGYSTSAPGVAIVGDVPTEFMRRPEPAPDKIAIAKALREGRAVEGAVLRNSSPHLFIRARRA
jgi:hypothetical protein